MHERVLVGCGVFVTTPNLVDSDATWVLIEGHRKKITRNRGVDALIFRSPKITGLMISPFDRLSLLIDVDINVNVDLPSQVGPWSAKIDTQKILRVDCKNRYKRTEIKSSNTTVCTSTVIIIISTSISKHLTISQQLEKS